MPSKTPIKIRGKRNSAKSTKKSGRPLIDPSKNGKRDASHTTTSPPQAKRQRQSTSSKRSMSTKQDSLLSNLEHLPTELLENVFFQCLNLNLPQASRILHHKLTTKHVKSQLFIEICSSKPSTRRQSLLEALFPTQREQAELQTAILQTKWMTPDFFNSLVPGYVTATLVQELGARNLRWMGQGPVVSKDSEASIRRYIDENMWRLKDSQIYGELPAYWEIVWSTDTEGESVCVGIGLGDGLVTMWHPCDSHYYDGVEALDYLYSYRESQIPPWSKWRLFSLADGCRIPCKLLRGPWHGKKSGLLECIIRGNATVDWISTTTGEVAKQGLLKAIRQSNVQATRALLERTGGLIPLDSQPVDLLNGSRYDAAVNNLEEGKRSPEVLSLYFETPVTHGVGIPVTTEHVRVAILEKGGNPEVVGELLAHALDRCVIDEEIHEWIIANSSHPIVNQNRYLLDEQLQLKHDLGSRRSDRLVLKDIWKKEPFVPFISL